MFKNYLLVALRGLSREKVYAGINLISLSLAVGCCLILSLYIRSELTYDRHHENHNSIYRVTNEIFNRGKGERFSITSQALGPLLVKEYPDIGEYVRFKSMGKTLLKTEDNEAFWQDVIMADPNVFDVFTHEIIYGNTEDALLDPYAIIISQRTSDFYFGNENPVGKTLYTDTGSYQIKAVFRNLPDNTHLKYDIVMSTKLLDNLGQGDATLTPRRLFYIGFMTYFHLADTYSESDLQRILAEFNEKIMTEPGREFELTIDFHTQPLLDVYFSSGWQGGPPSGNIFFIYGFIAVAIFILLVACINYTNLATARATKRAKEVGVRKVLGAEKFQLICQFLGESIVYTILAFIIGIIGVKLAETYTPLVYLLDKLSLVDFSEDKLFLCALFFGVSIVGIIAGVYPAFYLSSIPPVASLTANKKASANRISIRQVLIFIQFFVSISVVACTLIMGQQMHYAANKSLGYQQENKLAIQLYGAEAIQKIPLIKNELMADPNILGVAETSFVPGSGARISLMKIENNEGEFEKVGLFHMTVGDEFVDVMGLDIIKGRGFSKGQSSNEQGAVLVNETLVKTLGWDNPLGKRVEMFNATVIGVVRDFHVGSLHDPIPSLILRPFNIVDYSSLSSSQLSMMNRTLAISIKNTNVRDTIDKVESVVSQFDQEHPFEFKFYDNLLQELYADESNLMSLIGMFAAICIFISCLGLFGLSAFTTEQRTKEIGVRKVLGASTYQIIYMLVKPQMILVIIASFAASLTSYWIMNDWLNTFAYRADIEIWIFILATLIVATVAFITVVLQSASTANANPVKSLRYE
ncbi:FtsX-like permease family protein [Microbulbifer sp. JMSA004]|uniref:ABC transporter permease n=1 Tax=unclassified Microbulbifer TaxID=2619833 RepID=UPI0024ADEFE2|nr:ABC transporter permease [Microbulbifer sp. VAAF005]WHI44688.1 ABC transporter permease [Microbulbifer sp. VAAF005]